MSYNVEIITKPENKIKQYKIQELKELKEILEYYKNQTIEVNLQKEKVKKWKLKLKL